MEAAQSQVLLPCRRAKRSRTVDDHPQQLLRRIQCSCAHTQAPIPSRRGGRRNAKRRHLVRACSTQAPRPSWGAKCARTRISRCPQGSLLPGSNKWYVPSKLFRSDPDLIRDWADLADGPAGLIAELILANDVADYIRFRAVCRPWRRCSAEPRAHSGFDRRFHPRRWTMLREKLAAPHRRSFLNFSTGECIQVDLPELRDHDVLALTPEGLLVLLFRQPQLRTHVRLLNPLTRHLIELPPLTTLVSPDLHRRLSNVDAFFDYHSAAWGSGIANDGSTVVLSFRSFKVIGMAKPGDERWTTLKYNNSLGMAPLMFAGRFYCVTNDGVMVLDTRSSPPRLEVAAKLRRRISPMGDSFHLVDNGGELMLVHRSLKWTDGNKLARTYDVCRVDLDAGRLHPAKSFGGGRQRALFMGRQCSLFVSGEVFPSGSISGDTIYLSFDIDERDKTEAYHLADGTTEPAKYNRDGSVAQPHTLVDCLSLCATISRV